MLVSKKSLRYQPRYTDYIINWGCSKDWEFITLDQKYQNRICVDKLAFFEHMTAWNKTNPNCQVNLPEWTTDSVIAKAWNKTYFARTKLNGHSGSGIMICEDGEHYDAPLYVQYKKKKHEFRVHFFNDNGYKVIDVSQKKKKIGAPNVDTKIRNHKNGWIYARDGIVEPKDLRTQALNAAFASGLKFGAVDLIWNEKEDKCYVLEINTAPGLFETTLKNYANAFLKDIEK